MKLNFVFIFLLVVAGALSAIYFKVDQNFYSEKIQWNEAKSRSQLSALTHTVESEFENISRILDLTYPALGARDYDKSQASGRFEMISSFNVVNGDIQLDKKFFLEQSPVKAWGASYAYLALKSVKESELKQNLLFTLLDPQRKPWLMLVVPSKNHGGQYVAILATDMIQSFVDSQKGGMGSIAVVNNQSQVLGHSIGEYVGSLLKEDPLVQDILKSGNASGSGLFDGLQGERVHGFYEQVNNSNLYVVVSTPIRVLMADRNKIKMFYILLGIGISLLGVAMLLYFNSRETVDAKAPSMSSSESRNESVAMKAADPSVPPQAHAEMQVSKQFLPKAPQSKEPPALKKQSPPPPPVTAEFSEERVQQKSHDEAQFKELFSDKKIEETFSMIDQLESAPKPPPLPKSTEIKSSEEKTEVVDAVPISMDLEADTSPEFVLQEELVASEPPSLKKADFMIARIPNIKINRRVSKLDEMEVQIRKPGELR